MFSTMRKTSTIGILALAALLPRVEAGGCCPTPGECNDDPCPPNGGYARTCEEQQDCIIWTINPLPSDECGIGGDCPVEVCLTIDVDLPNCQCSPAFDRVCDQSDDNGCPERDMNDEPIFVRDGINTGAITMCQVGKPGQYLAWVLQDGFDDEADQPGGNMDFFWWGENKSCCSRVYCERENFQCNNANDNLSDRDYARTWWFEIPHPRDDGSCDVCDLSPSSPPTGAPPPPPPNPSSGTQGDPHFKTWKQEHFEYHGQCDLVLAQDPDFADGLGLEVHIRTKLVRYWSYIQSVAIRLGDDVLEVQGSADPEVGVTNYWFNLEPVGKLTTMGGFPVSFHARSQVKRRFEIDLSSKFPGQKIVISAYKEFLKVDFENGTEEAFGKTVGMLGNFATGQTLARDGVTVIDDFTVYGNEWQVLPTENMLFHSISEPQFPKKCIEPEDPQGQRRRLDENSLQEEEAEKACAGIQDPLDRKDCVYDVLATQDIDMVGAY
eukprot:scaffold2307_cov123-Cylindrotheca_fusiformis.AAC.5